MSGPKTSELEIERQRQQRIAELRHGIVDEAARIVERLDEMARACGEGASEGAKSEQASLMLLTVQRALDDVERLTALDIGADLDELEAAAARARRELLALEASVEEKFARQCASLKAAAARSVEQAGLEAFAADIEASGAATHEDVAAALALLARDVERSAAQAPAREGALELIARAASLTRQPDLTARNRAFLLDSLSAVRASLPDGADERALAGACAQLSVVLPRIESEISAMRAMRARARALEAHMSRRGLSSASPATFATLDEAAAHVTSLEEAAARADEREYVRACIDEVMGRHGYDIARSANLGPAHLGQHIVFTGSGEDTRAGEGIHAFMSAQGDLMLEVVGVNEADLARDDMHIAPTTKASRRADLLDAQKEFCSVYAQIEQELAEFGITSTARHKAAPDAAHCKEIVAGRAEGASSQGDDRAEGAEGRAGAGRRARHPLRGR